MTDWPLILAEHGPTVWRTVYRLLDHHADALDCYQETFLAAWRFAERAPVADWPSFLTSLATRRAMDRLDSATATELASSPSTACVNRAARQNARFGTPAPRNSWTACAKAWPNCPTSRPRCSG